MPVSLQDLHKPISEFFLNKFGTVVNGGVAFRFDKFGSVLTDADFIDENHPELGLQRPLAVEKLSDLVNRVPIDTGDGANIVLSQAAIDDIYFFRLLTPSLVAVPHGVDDATKESLTESFNALKAGAIRDWERLTLASSSGLALTFKPSVAQPEDWYDGNASQAWATHTFLVGSSQPGATETSPPLWRLKPKIGILANELKVEPKVLLKPEFLLDRNMLLNAITARPIEIGAGPTITRRPDVPAEPDVRVNIRDLLGSQLRTMRFDDRVILNRRLREIAPQAPVTTSSVSISFDYCLVNIGRPWWMDAFINHSSWYVPAVGAGEVTSGKRPGTIAWLPVAFVATRNLAVTAQWSPGDAAQLPLVSDFGPFHVEFSGEQTLKHRGVQVVGWLLQALPSLPPTGSTESAPTTTQPRTYTVLAGDTLWKIAQQLYGDGRRYPEIQHANGIADPNKIYVGQALSVP